MTTNSPGCFERSVDGYTISTDKRRLDFAVIHGFLRDAYWSLDVPLDVVKRAAAHSLCFGVYQEDAQIGYARVITDHATFAYLADVFILEAHRGKGLSKHLIATIKDHPDLQGLRRWLLFTRDAHGLYEQFGFARAPGVEERLMAWEDPTYPRKLQES